MSAHNVLQEQLVADHTLIAPVAADDEIQVDRSPAFIDATGTTSNFKISKAAAAGLSLVINNGSGTPAVSAIGGGNFFCDGTDNTAQASFGLTANRATHLVSVNISGAIVWKELMTSHA